MQINFSLTPGRVESLKNQAAEADSKMTEDRKEAILALPDGGYEYTGEKEEFDSDFPDFVEWLTGASITVDSGDASYAKHLVIEHAKFSLAEAGRRFLETAEYTEAGNLTKASKDKLDAFVAEYKPSPGRSSSLSNKSDEELAEETRLLEKKLEKIRQITAQRS